MALLAGLTALLAAIFLSDVLLRELTEGPRLTVVAAEAAELQPGSEVWIAGVPAGRVTSVRMRPPEASGRRPVLVRAVLREGAGRTLRADAEARIRASSLLAPSVVAIRPGRSGRPFDYSDTLEAEPRLDREDVLGRADSLARALAGLEPLADSLRRRLTEGPGTLAALRRDERLLRRLGRAGEALRRLAERIPRGTAARLAADTAARASLRRIARGARSLSEQAVQLRARRDSLRRQLDTLAARLDELGRHLEAGRGTLGRWLRDGALQRQRRLLRARMDSVTAELLVDPLRWLRFRLF